MKQSNRKHRSCDVRLFIALLCASLSLGLAAGTALAEDGRMIGLTVSDDVLLRGDAQAVTLAEDLDIVTNGVDGALSSNYYEDDYGTLLSVHASAYPALPAAAE